MKVGTVNIASPADVEGMRVVSVSPAVPDEFELDEKLIVTMAATTPDTAGATARLEHLILPYPQSALVPQARRELGGDALELEQRLLRVSSVRQTLLDRRERPEGLVRFASSTCTSTSSCWLPR